MTTLLPQRIHAVSTRAKYAEIQKTKKGTLKCVPCGVCSFLPSRQAMAAGFLRLRASASSPLNFRVPGVTRLRESIDK